MWKFYAKEYLGETNHLRGPKIMISYVDWFLEQEYREQISKKLNLKPSELYIQRVPNYGRGSSFDLRKMNNKAQDMKVLERWKEYKDHKFIKKILKDKEAMELNERIFGNSVKYKL